MTASPEAVASLVLAQFDRLPAKRKPVVRSNGIHEWVPMSGIVAQDRDGNLHCISLATGMKCLPQTKISQAGGSVLHDWHAEILAIRAFNRFVLEECRVLALDPATVSPFVRRRTNEEIALAIATASSSPDSGDWHGQAFAWRENVPLYMYCSEAPCGDASMELTMAAQDDASPWDVPAPTIPTTSPAGSDIVNLPGRAYFSILGAVRRKPARSDAPPTLSKSCSDKLAMKQCTSLLASTVSLLVCPDSAYIHTLILPESEHSATGCTRAFSREGRMAAVAKRVVDVEASKLPGGYAFHPFEVAIVPQSAETSFPYGKRVVAERAAAAAAVSNGDGQGKKIGTAASNLAMAWIAVPTGGSSMGSVPSSREETTLGGIVQGRKPPDPRAASFASRKKLWCLASEVAGLVQPHLQHSDKGAASLLETCIYSQIKECAALQPRRRVKEDTRTQALKGWVQNIGDEEFGK